MTDDLLPPLAEKFRTLWPHQVPAIRQAIEKFQAGETLVVLDAPTGCLVGSTRIGVNRAKKGFTLPISEVVARFNGAGAWTRRNGIRKATAAWSLDVETYVQASDGETMVLRPLVAAVESGMKPTSILFSESGRSIQATLEHPFLTPSGWKPLGLLRPGDQVYVLGGRQQQTTGRKPQYRITNMLRAHPFCSRRGVDPRKGGHSVPTHRLVVEAQMNGLTLDKFVRRIRLGDVSGLAFLDPSKWHVHHEDGDTFNNRLDNLSVKSVSEHHRHHALCGGWRRVGLPIIVDRVAVITEADIEMTYDLIMNEPHNFIANQFVVHNSGKTVIAEYIRRALKTQALYVTMTKQLQAQVTKDFPFSRLIMGRANYPTADGGGQTADDCDAWRPGCVTKECRVALRGHCSFCHPTEACPYLRAKAAALQAPLAVANGAYVFGEWKAKGQFKDWPLVILDEWDGVESALLNSLDITLLARDCYRFRVRPPEDLSVVTPEWVVDLAKAVMTERQRTIGGDEPQDWPQLQALAESLETAAKGLLDKTWIVLFASRELGVSLGPVSLEQIGKAALWQHGRRWLLMSATAIDPRWRLKMLGWTDPVPVIRVPSTYPVKNRPVYIWPVARMVYREREQALPKLGQAIGQILRRHPRDRVLIHSGTYAIAASFAEQLRTEFRDRLVTFQNARGRDEALSRYLTRPASVLIAPAMEKGVDLPDDACRVQIIARVPYPFQQDPRVEARRQLPGWWLTQAIATIADLVQASGRGMRHRDDTCATWILDAQFQRIRMHGLYYSRWPVWWRAAWQDFRGWPDEKIG